MSALVAGLLFGAGLALSGMTQPAKVIGFLDVAGAWDPSLALVMGGGVVVLWIAEAARQRRAAPWFAPRFSPLAFHGIDARLVGGAALFGVGWGLSGLCPGPALCSAAAALVGLGGRGALWFVPAMAGGMLLHRWATRPDLATVDETGEAPQAS